MPAQAKPAKQAKKGEGPIHAGDVLDAPAASWSERTWEARREAGDVSAAFCDRAASRALARVAELGGAQPSSQRFLSRGALQLWRAEFAWGWACCASRGGEFWLRAEEVGEPGARVEMNGPEDQWDDDAVEAFAGALL